MNEAGVYFSSQGINVMMSTFWYQFHLLELWWDSLSRPLDVKMNICKIQLTFGVHAMTGPQVWEPWLFYENIFICDLHALSKNFPSSFVQNKQELIYQISFLREFCCTIGRLAYLWRVHRIPTCLFPVIDYGSDYMNKPILGMQICFASDRQVLSVHAVCPVDT